MFNIFYNNSEQGRFRAEVIKKGVGFGTALAICISWSQNASILWAIVHGIFSWLYVIYFILFVR